MYAGGNSYVCGLLQGGSVICTGSNAWYEDMSNPPKNLSGIMAMDASYVRACAVYAGGYKIFCWGRLLSDLGTYGNETFDVFKKVKQITTGSKHICMLYDDGTVDCRGDNTYGQTDIPLGLRDIVEIRASYVYDDKTCALRNDDSVICWGK